VHLTTAAVSYMKPFRVDLDVLWWYQKQAGLVGVFPVQGHRLHF
jgi:hypothetical protein